MIPKKGTTNYDEAEDLDNEKEENAENMSLSNTGTVRRAAYLAKYKRK